MVRYYCTYTDDFGVLCVEEMQRHEHEWTPEQVAAMANIYPDVIYFSVSRNGC